MPSQQQIKDIIRDINAGLRSGLSSSIKVAKATSTAEDAALLQEDLNGYADEIGAYINLDVPFDQDVIIAYAELRRLAAELNEDNRADNDGRDILAIPRPYTIHPDTHAVTTFPFPELPLATATGSGNNTNHVPYGEDNHGHGHGHGHYHEMVEHHPLIAGAHEDNGCCGGCIMM